MMTAQVTLKLPELTPLIHSPRLPLYIQQLQTWMETEQTRRERFYEEMSEEHKMEFIK